MDNKFGLIKKLVKKYMKQEIIGLIVTILYSTAVFLAPYASQYLIDDVLISNNYSKIYFGIGIFFAICIAQPVFAYIKSHIFLVVSEKIALDLRKKVFNAVINTTIPFFYKNSNGELVNKVLNDGRTISDFITDIFVIVVKDVLLIVAIIVGMCIQSWKISLIIFAFLCCSIFLNISFGKKFQKVSKESAEGFDAYCTTVEQSLNNIHLIKSYGLEKYTEDRIEKNMLDIYKTNKKIGKYNNLLTSFNEIIVVSCLCIIYGLGAVLVMKKQITLGAVISLGLYFQLISQPISELLSSNISYNKVVPIIKRVDEFLQLEKEELIDNKVLESNINEVKINFQNVTFKYPEENNLVLNNVNLSMDEKGLYSIIGKSGSGKSTIAKLLVKFYEPTSGKVDVLVNNEKLTSARDIRSVISYVSQDTQLLNTSIYNNLILNNKNISKKDIEDICKKLKIHEKILSLDGGYDSIINEKINLSGGEKQRLSIARAYLQKSKIYIFDEITSALDNGTEKEVLDVIKELAKDNIVIFITHKLELTKNSKEIFVVDNHKVIKMRSNDNEELSKNCI